MSHLLPETLQAGLLDALLLVLGLGALFVLLRSF